MNATMNATNDLLSNLVNVIDGYPDYQPTPLVIDAIESNFNLSAVKFVSKAEIVGTKESDVYVRLNVHLIDGGIATVRRANDQPIGKLVTEQGDLIIVKLTRLAYGNSEAQGASALHGYTRISESKDEIYLAVSRDSNKRLTVNYTMTYGVKDKTFSNTGVYAGHLLTDADREHFASLVNTHLMRIEANKNPRDSRYTDIGGKRTPIGMFGALKRQNAK